MSRFRGVLFINPAAGVNRRLVMTVQPYITTSYPIAENVSVGERLSLTLPELGYETCFSFENAVSTREVQAAGLAQPYKAFAQIVTIEVR